MKNFAKKLVLLMAGTLLFASCGAQKPMVTDLKVNPYYDNSEVHVALTATLSLGNVSLPGVSLPVLMPSTGESIGSVQLQTISGGKNLISIDVNLSQITQINSSFAQLPNGNILPIIGTNEVIVIPIKNHVKLYLTLSDKVAALGVSIPFSTLDGIGAKTGSVSLFPTFNIKNVIGSAGMYFSKTAGNNGFGLFADLSNVLEPIMLQDMAVQKQEVVSYSKSRPMPIQLNYRSINPSRSSKRKIDDGLYQLHRRSSKLVLR